MTPFLGVTDKASKQWPLKFALAASLVLIVFAVSEFLLENRLAASDTRLLLTSCEQSKPPGLPRGQNGSGKYLTSLVLANSPTVQETLASPEFVIHWDNITERAPKGLRTWIDTNETENARYLRYGLSPVKNICVRPNGTLVVVGVSQGEFSRNLLAAGEAMLIEWNETYDCHGACIHDAWHPFRNGVAFETETPEGALWISGNTTHVIPHLGNVFHHFAERVWPHVSGLREPVNQYYMHMMHRWLDQANSNIDRHTLLYQQAILARMSGPGTKLLQHREAETRPLCFERFKLSSATSGRLNPLFGVENFTPGLERYRNAAFEYFRIPKPQLSIPPHPLRLTVYGRRDTTRRRVSNIIEVVEHLRNWTQPPLLVTFIDELLESGAYKQTLPEVVSLMAQTDVLISVHGANTWATLFMPRRAAVIEIKGPCGPWTWLHSTITPALELKHNTEGNPWGERVASPVAGNTTDCISARATPDFTLDIDRLDEALRNLSLPSGPGDRFPLYWLYDWKMDSY